VSIGKIRAVLYRAARFLGDVNAVKRHRVAERVERRFVGRFFGRLMGWIFRRKGGG
jgi:hypothetical protein